MPAVPTEHLDRKKQPQIPITLHTVSISLFSKMGDMEEGGVKNLKKEVTYFVTAPLYTFF